MPNNVTNTLTISGPNKDRVALKALMGGDTPFDFEKILPMPDALKGIKTGWCTIDGKRFEQWREVNGKSVGVTDEELQGFKAKYGAIDWYKWAIDNWGTKWNAYASSSPKETARSLVYQFDTAWDSPSKVIKALSARFPALSFRIRCTGEVDHPFSYGIKAGRPNAKVGRTFA